MVATNLLGPGIGRAAESLERLGFSPYEARAYLALLAHGPCNGYQLSKLSRVPRSKIYETLERLVDRGLVLASRGDPADYAAVAGEELIGRLRRELDSSIGALESAVADLRFAGRAESVWNLRGRSSILARARRMVEKASRGIYLATWSSVIEELRDALETAIRRERQPVVVSCGEVSLPGAHLYRHGFEDQVCAATCASIQLVVDGAEALAGDLEPADRCEAAWTRNPGLVLAVEEYIRHEVYLHKIAARLEPVAAEELRLAIAEGLAEMPYTCRC